MAADPDIVLNTAADLTRAAAWLPTQVDVVSAGDGEVEVAWTPDAETYRYAVTCGLRTTRSSGVPSAITDGQAGCG